MSELEKKICPHCGSDMFMATITRGGIVKVAISPDNKDVDNIEIIKEIQDKCDVVVVKCARCRNEITAQDLIVGVKCATCGNDTSPDDIDENGNCGVCSAIINRQELANASKEDLIRMLIEAEKKINPVNDRIDKKEKLAEKSQELIQPIEETSSEAEISEPAEEKEVKPTRTPRKKKNAKNVKNTDKEETESEETESEEPESEEPEAAPEEVISDTNVEQVMDEVIQDEVDNIANQQEAPFPDAIPEATTLVESEKIEDVLPGFSDSIEPSEDKFKMFDDSEDVI